MAVLANRHAAAGIVFLDGDATPLAVPPFLGRLLINPYRTTLARLALSQGWLIQGIYASQCGPNCRPLSAAGVEAWRRPLQQPGFLQVVAYELGHGIPSMSDQQLRELRATAVPKLVVYGRDDPQMNAAQADAAVARIGALPPVAIPGGHLTMISSPRQLASAINALSRPHHPAA
jgi:pimeloyl-ACP methyl ester carboxylesterase